ncbi:MAG: energy transducer TonB [Flavobacterium sp.]
MKKLFSLFFILFISISFAQNKNKEPNKDFLPLPKIGTTILCDCNENSENINDENKIYPAGEVDVRPELLGWIKKEQFIKDNFKTPIVNGEKIEGKIYVILTIEKDGTISNINIIRNVGNGTGEEAKRVLQNMPRWNSAKKNGKSVRCWFPMPITIP